MRAIHIIGLSLVVFGVLTVAGIFILPTIYAQVSDRSLLGGAAGLAWMFCLLFTLQSAVMFLASLVHASWESEARRGSQDVKPIDLEQRRTSRASASDASSHGLRAS